MFSIGWPRRQTSFPLYRKRNQLREAMCLSRLMGWELRLNPAIITFRIHPEAQQFVKVSFYTVHYRIWSLRQTYESECHWMTLITDKGLRSLRLNSFPFRWQCQGGPLNTELSILNSLFSCCQWFPNYVLQSRGISEHRHWGLADPLWALILHLSLYLHYLQCGLTAPRTKGWGLFPYPCSRLALWTGFDQKNKVKVMRCPSQA